MKVTYEGLVKAGREKKRILVSVVKVPEGKLFYTVKVVSSVEFEVGKEYDFKEIANKLEDATERQIRIANPSAIGSLVKPKTASVGDSSYVKESTVNSVDGSSSEITEEDLNILRDEYKEAV